MSRVYSIYSTYDVGDVFCLAYSTRLNTVFLGAQNTSIQWCDLSRRHDVLPSLSEHPSQRTHRFFDSKGPGGVSTPRPVLEPELESLGGDLVQIPKADLIPYAHFGYVYCMAMGRGLAVGEPDAEILVSGGGDGIIKMWGLHMNETSAMTELGSLENGDSPVLAVALKGTLLYAGRSEGEVNVWDLESRQLIRAIKAHEADILTIAVGQGLTITGAAGGHCKAFERQQVKSDWEAHRGSVLASATTKYNGRSYLVTGGSDGCVVIWDMSGYIAAFPREGEASDQLLVQSLSQFVAIPTVSCQREYAEDCHQGASWLRSLFKQFGASTEMLTTDELKTNPVVLATFRGKGLKRRRLLFYGHYDVVAAGQRASKWTSNPFRMEGRDGYLYGRGVTDNKGPLLAAIFATADLLKEQQLEHDIVFLIEGEEECGSRGFEEIVRNHKSSIGQVDWILLANSYWLIDDFPCLTYGLRGSLHLNIKVRSEKKDLHSGVHGSAGVAEPLQDLVALISSIRGQDGRILIPGFYNDIPRITDAEEQWYNRISEVLQRNDPGNDDAESLKARWREPSFTVHGFDTSNSGGNATVIPHLASVDISFRLVPNQDSSKIPDSILGCLRSRFQDMKSTNKMTISRSHPVEPWLGDPENEIYQALEKAIVDVWGLGLDKDVDSHGHEASDSESSIADVPRSPKKTTRSLSSPKKRASRPTNQVALKRLRKPLYIREGGSIPAIRFLEKALGAPAAQIPCGQASDNAHLENERFRLLNLYNSRKIFRQVFRSLPKRSGK